MSVDCASGTSTVVRTPACRTKPWSMGPMTYRPAISPELLMPSALPDDLPEDAVECRWIRHGVPHEAGQACVGVNHHQLPAIPRRVHIDTLGLEALARCVPVGERRHQDDALSVRETSTNEPADGAVEKILVLIELHDVIAWDGVHHDSIPSLTLTVKL